MGNGYYKGMNYKDTTYYEGKYYTFPIEILRCLMDEPEERLRDVLCHHSALLEGDSQAEFMVLYKLSNKDLERGIELLNCGSNSGVNFSITARMFDRYYCNPDSKQNKDWLLLLAYLSLKSLQGKYKVVLCDSERMFIRMAGYVGKSAFDEGGGLKAVGCIGEYMQNERKAREWSKKLRIALMDAFNEFHTYSSPHKRGFAYMFSNQRRDRCLQQMAAFMEQRTAKYKENLYKQMMRDAEKAIKSKPKPANKDTS